MCFLPPRCSERAGQVLAQRLLHLGCPSVDIVSKITLCEKHGNISALTHQVRQADQVIGCNTFIHTMQHAILHVNIGKVHEEQPNCLFGSGCPVSFDILSLLCLL